MGFNVTRRQRGRDYGNIRIRFNASNVTRERYEQVMTEVIRMVLTAPVLDDSPREDTRELSFHNAG